ncbi:MAG: hypothetical protein QXU88_01340 [Candidatus Woesearchaeota archaeon]
MRCQTHSRLDAIGACNWCGSKLCERCVERADGRKFYCGKCTPMLATLPSESFPRQIKPVRVIFRDGVVQFQPATK